MNVRRLFLVLAATVAGICLAPLGARAAEVPTRTCGIERVGSHVAVSVGLSDLLNATDRRNLYSGFVTRVLLRIYVYQGDAREPVVTAFRRAELVYDIWDETFQVRVVDSQGRNEIRSLATEAEAVSAATDLQRFPLVEAARLVPGSPYRLGVRGDLNPLDEDRLADLRRWLMRPSGGRGAMGSGDSFFGSFVSIFVNPRIEESARQVRFLSQVFVRPAVTDGP